MAWKTNSPYFEIAGEEWKDIKGYEGLYSVSNLGRIRIEEKVCMRNLRIQKPIKMIKTFFKTPKGYCFACLHDNGKHKQYYVHRIVGQAFIQNSDNKKYINHKNGIKEDNRAENLEWVTFSENMKHAFAMGLASNAGERAPNAILTEADVRLIKSLFKTHTNQEILDILKLPKTKRHLVANIRCGRLWKFVA